MQANESFRLVVRRGPQPNQIYELKQDSLSLGRDIKNDIVINDPEVSRHHLQITRTADGYTIEDMGSTNGTFMGGQRINSPRALNHGDLIGLGETVTLQYERVRLAPAYGEAAAPYAPPQAQQPVQPSPYAPPQAQQPVQPRPYAPPQAQQPVQPSPYAPPQAQQPVQPSPYAPPQAQQPAQPSPYAPPQAQQPVQPTYDPQQQQQQAAYGAGYYAPQAPVAAGYDHDPAAVREDEGRNTLRWVGIGCGALTVVCCCSSTIGLVIIDSANLWDSIPILPDLLRPIAQLIWGG